MVLENLEVCILPLIKYQSSSSNQHSSVSSCMYLSFRLLYAFITFPPFSYVSHLFFIIIIYFLRFQWFLPLPVLFPFVNFHSLPRCVTSLETHFSRPLCRFNQIDFPILIVSPYSSCIFVFFHLSSFMFSFFSHLRRSDGMSPLPRASARWSLLFESLQW